MRGQLRGKPGSCCCGTHVVGQLQRGWAGPGQVRAPGSLALGRDTVVQYE